ncbi:hypothetical protein [Salmonella enterica]|uniref:hypothetical protein n=1 Tax=Salmonella enterica TaxID=28901 RepID=UPI0020C77AAF|nr:hypothetical protein [Salmonella enterica]
MAMGSVVHLLFFLSEQCYLMPFSTYRIGTEASANPVSGQRQKVNFTTSTYNIGKNTRNLSIGVHAYCSWTYLNGAPFGGFQQVYSDQNKVWYVNNYAWGNYESGGTITVTCLNLPGAGI